MYSTVTILWRIFCFIFIGYWRVSFYLWCLVALGIIHSENSLLVLMGLVLVGALYCFIQDELLYSGSSVWEGLCYPLDFVDWWVRITVHCLVRLLQVFFELAGSGLSNLFEEISGSSKCGLPFVLDYIRDKRGG